MDSDRRQHSAPSTPIPTDPGPAPLGSAVLATLIGLLVTGLLGCRESDSIGAPKFPVRGSVSVNGAPAQGVLVYFKAVGDDLEGKDRSPVGVTDSAGRFELATMGRADGAAAGVYEVTFKWPYHPLMTDHDRFRGKYDSPLGSGVQVSVEERSTELDPFLLTAPEEWLQDAAEAAGS